MYDSLDFIGAEATDIAKMFGQMLSGAGGMFKPQSKGQDAVAVAAMLKAQEDKQRAEASAARMKTGLLAMAAAAAVGGAWWLKSRK